MVVCTSAEAAQRPGKGSIHFVPLWNIGMADPGNLEQGSVKQRMRENILRKDLP